MTRLHWVRHGPTHATVMVGWTDRPADLSDGAALARLDAALPREARLVSSDLWRARATADRLGQGRVRLPADPRLREIHFGAWEGRSFAEIEAGTPQRMRAFWQEAGPARAPGGETWHELQARVTEALQSLCAAHPDEEIVIVCHFGPILVALQVALGLGVQEAFAHRIEPLSITSMTLAGGNWRVEAINRLA
ncbi:histidine phosphatase family protein [Cereibacter sphaeroides]|uniref:histidine phosphatase family protein n=1 Tax=Cereibacter sphaeroides TaxID=1063 RepID=UPI000E5B96F8|nr:histidine phosphatase family protein [Cereibacter sphaeroides]RHZ91868.1 histidine phosphatase family protein [Cereibacter sphaeroides]